MGYINDCNRPETTVNHSLKIITFIETNIYYSLSTNRQGLAYSLLFVGIYNVCAFLCSIINYGLLEVETENFILWWLSHTIRSCVLSNVFKMLEYALNTIWYYKNKNLTTGYLKTAFLTGAC